MAAVLHTTFIKFVLLHDFFFQNFTEILFPKVQIDNTPILVRIMVWRTGDKPLSELMMAYNVVHSRIYVSLGVRELNNKTLHDETFSALLAICAGNSRVPGEFPHKGH